MGLGAVAPRPAGRVRAAMAAASDYWRPPCLGRRAERARRDPKRTFEYSANPRSIRAPPIVGRCWP